MKFLKMHGLGNDFVIMDARTQSITLTPAQIQHICDRHLGVGCDQLVLMQPSEKADVFARFYNPDGSESAACGNASRCIADIVMKEQGAKSCSIETGYGVLPAQIAEKGLITVDMGAPASIKMLEGFSIPHPHPNPLPGGEGSEAYASQEVLAAAGEGTNTPISVDMGNPHCIFFVENLADIPVEELGPKIEHHPLFPQRTNVEFVQLLEDGRLRQRTWERGAGETQACGSGACAVGVAAIRRELVDGRNVEILLNGGTLHIEWRESDDHVLMTGPVAYVFDGEIKDL